jgi:acetyl/propionyl-CoA carboxylase alpha subunit
VNAIHPGYGFLSENEEFCGAVEAAGIVWLGPSAKTLHDFALKHVAREIAEKAGVSTAFATHNKQLLCTLLLLCWGCRWVCE